MWDVFISFAWQDEDIAGPLAEALTQAGLRVWYAGSTQTLGDSLRRSIDHGLAQSRYGVVILSPHFFAKEWTQYELDGLVTREISSGKTILPVWHNVTREDVERFSPTLAGKLAVSTAEGLEAVVGEILQALLVDLKPEPTWVAPQPKAHKMIEVHFSNEILAQYKVYSLCCHKLLDSYEELCEVCNIRELVDEFDARLRKSYVGDKYGLAVRSVEHYLELLIIQYNSNTDACEKLTTIRWAITRHADDWNFRPALIEFGDIGKGLAQDFYREGGRSPNKELIDSKAPALVFSNQCLLSENPGCRFAELQPISILPDGMIHLPFTKDFGFCCYLSYPVLFFHEYVSHVYLPEEIESQKFREGWLMYAIELFMKTRWTELCEKYPLTYAQIGVLGKVWEPDFTRLARRGYELAKKVNLYIDNDKFLHFTWDLASYPPDIAEPLDFHVAFLDRIKPYTSPDGGHLLRSAAETSTSALQLYENLKKLDRDKF